MASLLKADEDQLKRIGQEAGIQLFGGLLWAEARRLGINPKIRISGRINVPDGGVDASTENNEHERSVLLEKGYTGFQVKTGTTFGLQKAKLKEELFGDKDVSFDNLGVSVRYCLEHSGRFVFVCFGLDPTEKEVVVQAIAWIDEWLKQCGFATPSIDIWGLSELKGFIDFFPALVLAVNQRAIGPLETFEMWRQRGSMRPDKLSLGDPQQKIIEGLREKFLSNPAAIKERIIGESGVGKTRLALEILSDEKLNPLVLYTDQPAELERMGFLTEITMPGCELEIILVLDECPRTVEAIYWDRLQNLGKRIRLLTIYNNEETGRENVSVPPLEKDKIVEILSSYGVPAEHISRWADFCEGSPRWAQIIGANLQSNAEDILKDPDNVSVVDRYITGPDRREDQGVKDRIVVVRFLALFRKFGFKGEVSQEAKDIFELIKKYDSSISQRSFDDSVNVLHERRILQGEKTYYITPRPLHIKLWVEWWDNYGDGFDIKNFDNLPPSLSGGFNDMMRFADESQAAKKNVEKLLGEEGPFADGRLLESKEGTDFFLALTEAAPEEALFRLERTLGVWNENRLEKFKTGRMTIVWALERIAVWKDLFKRAAILLLKLAKTENDFLYSNNSTGTFKNLFSIFSVTEESPLERFSILEMLLSSENKEEQKIGLQSVSVALDHHYSRMIGAEYQGIKKEPHLWSAREYPDVAGEYMTKVWRLLMDSVGKFEGENESMAENELLHQIKVMARNPGASLVGLDDAKKIASKKIISRERLIEAVIHTLHFGAKELPEDIKKEWRAFYDELAPREDLSAQLERYVALNLTEDYFDDDGVYSEEKKEKGVSDLAVLIYKDLPVLKDNLSWLVTQRAQNGYTFGYHIGKLDKDKGLLQIILDARRHAVKEQQPNQYFLGGYLRGIYEDDLAEWDVLFKTLVTDELYLKLLPELAWRVSIDDVIADTLIELIQAGKISPRDLGYFKYGPSVRTLSTSRLEKWIKLLVNSSDRFASSLALDIFERYFGDPGAGHEMSKELALEVLTNPNLFKKTAGPTDPMDEFLWAKIAKRFMGKHGDDKAAMLKIGFIMLDSLGNDGSIVDHSDQDVGNVLHEISSRFPEEMWVRALGSIEEKGYFIFKHWLNAEDFFGNGDTPSPLVQKIKLDGLWKWIDEKKDERAWFVASFVPSVIDNEPGKICLAREILIRYGDREDVRRNLMGNFMTGSWTGPASEHYRQKLEAIEPIRKKESDPNVTKWLDDYIKQLKASIESAKTGEERDEFWI